MKLSPVRYFQFPKSQQVIYTDSTANMADFGAYPPNMAPQNALIVRQAAGADLIPRITSAIVCVKQDKVMTTPFFKQREVPVKVNSVRVNILDEVVLQLGPRDVN